MARGGCTLRLAIVLAALPICASPALADDLAGRWKFETADIAAKDCRIAGDIQFTRSSTPGGYACSFVSRETCDREPEDTFQVVKQTCIATLQSGELTILSRVERIMDAGPASQRGMLMDPDTYRADNFKLKPTSAAEMLGEFFSINRAKVRFWREEDLTS